MSDGIWLRDCVAKTRVRFAYTRRYRQRRLWLLTIVRWWEDATSPCDRGKLLTTVPQYGLVASWVYSRGTPQPDYRESAPVPASADSRCNRPSVPEVVNTTQMAAYSVRSNAGTGLLRLLPAGPPSSRFPRMSPGVTEKRNPPGH